MTHGLPKGALNAGTGRNVPQRGHRRFAAQPWTISGNVHDPATTTATN
jgi:hypothetical protein